MFDRNSFVFDDTINVQLLNMILSAKKRIIICSPFFDSKSRLLGYLLDALNGEVKIDIITREKTGNKKEHMEALKVLHSKGAEIFFHNKVHAKMVIVDFKQLLLSSANFTATSLLENSEAGIYTKVRSVVNTAIGYIELLISNCDSEMKDEHIKTFDEENYGHCIICNIQIDLD